MKIFIAQLNTIIGDIDGNIDKAIISIELAKNKEADLIIFSELYISGYPPKDLLEKKWFLENVKLGIDRIVKVSMIIPDIGIIIGSPTKGQGNELYNSALLINNGKIVFKQDKTLLPNYDVFDEKRYFKSAEQTEIVKFKGEILGLSICEDAWGEKTNPLKKLKDNGASLIINISASPFDIEKESRRKNKFEKHVKELKIPLIFVNHVGGNDDLIFDGRSLVIDKNGRYLSVFPSFKEKEEIIDLNSQNYIEYEEQHKLSTVYNALVLGVRDYIRKCGFKTAVVGLSGGIDSAVTCAIAVAAIGKENVLGITMPTRYSSKGSVDDSVKLAENLGIKLLKIPIDEIFQSYIDNLDLYFKDKKEDVTEENIQARIRGNILMAFSNKFGHIVLSTGNKSELAVGYCTLYGDMSGGLAVISDVPKTMVYKLAGYINRGKEIIPEVIINKPPSAELRPNQFDQDSLPPYEILDEILYYYIEENLSEKEIIERGFEGTIVKEIIRKVNTNEYKRKQAPPGLKVTSKAFGWGRRMPIAVKITGSQ